MCRKPNESTPTGVVGSVLFEYRYLVTLGSSETTREAPFDFVKKKKGEDIVHSGRKLLPQRIRVIRSIVGLKVKFTFNRGKIPKT